MSGENDEVDNILEAIEKIKEKICDKSDPAYQKVVSDHVEITKLLVEAITDIWKKTTADTLAPDFIRETINKVGSDDLARFAAVYYVQMTIMEEFQKLIPFAPQFIIAEIAQPMIVDISDQAAPILGTTVPEMNKKMMKLWAENKGLKPNVEAACKSMKVVLTRQLAARKAQIQSVSNLLH